jgi:hypothetical protein
MAVAHLDRQRGIDSNGGDPMSRQWNQTRSAKVRASWWLAAPAALLVLGAVLLWVRTPEPARTATESPGISAGGSGFALARRETRPTLDPARFVGKAARAHQVAREIPDVLDRLYCYCECDRHLGHKSLLSCFTDGHAAT